MTAAKTRITTWGRYRHGATVVQSVTFYIVIVINVVAISVWLSEGFSKHTVDRPTSHNLGVEEGGGKVGVRVRGENHGDGGGIQCSGECVETERERER